jgi:RHS repeat-associated protein
VYANGKLMAEQTPDGQFYWTHNDHLGSTRKLTSTSGAVVYRGEFDPFGQAVLETGSVSLNSHKFTGYERDWATGLDYANARMYTSQYGRFMQSDPVSYGCGNKKPDILAGARKRKPQSFNRYSYVYSDPINLIDPKGLDPYSGSNCFIEGGDIGDWSGGWAGGGPGFGGEGAWGESTGAGSCGLIGLASGEDCNTCEDRESSSCHLKAVALIAGINVSVGAAVGAILAGGVGALLGALVGVVGGTAANVTVGYLCNAVSESYMGFWSCVYAISHIPGANTSLAGLASGYAVWDQCVRSARSRCRAMGCNQNT